MRLAWLTDVHFNFVKAPAFRDFLEQVAATGADALVVTGDIGEGPSTPGYLNCMAQTLARPIYFVLGNHDFYKDSFAQMAAAVKALAAKEPRLIWLNEARTVELAPGTALVGHDTWADGRLGDLANSPLLLSDFFQIEDFKLAPPDRHPEMMRGLADAGAAHLRAVLPVALASHAHVICAVHVPPFAEASWHEGRPSNKDWLPFFSSKASGDAILEAARQFPEKKLTVLCGHTHGSGEYAPLPNVTVLTGGAEYGKPAVQRVFEVD